MKVRINKQKLTDTEIISFNKSKKIYIPLISGDDKDITILVKKNEYVYKGSIIGKRKGDCRIPICSSVSGRVVGFQQKECRNGKKVKCVVIENDFKEEIENKIILKKNINKYTKEEFIERIRENGIVGLGGSGYPTYLKYSNKIETLIVNAVECDKFSTSDEIIAKQKVEEILETIDAILEINNIKEAIIVVRKDSILKTIYDNFIGTYLKIKLRIVSSIYPNGWERKLVKDILNVEYNKYPIEKGIIVNNISTIYAIYEALKYNKPLIERVITFAGDNIKKPFNILVKIGTPINEILSYLKVKNNSIIVAGGPLMGCKADDLIASANLNCVLALKPNENIPSECIRCGKCISVCPVNLCPVLIMNCKNNVNKIKSLHPEKCIECGLCSYICPAKIALREEVKKAKQLIGGGK